MNRIVCWPDNFDHIPLDPDTMVQYRNRLFFGEPMMTNLSTYTTSELARLSTLQQDTTQVRCGEFVTFGAGVVFLRTEEKSNDWRKFIRVDGGFGNAAKHSAFPVRRVRSFTDLTEVDPPVSVMQAELRRREQSAEAAKAFNVGDTVRWCGNTYQVKAVNPTTTTNLTLTRKDGWMDVYVDATTVTKVDPPQPQPIPGQVYRHRETTDERPDSFSWPLYRYTSAGTWDRKDHLNAGSWYVWGTNSWLDEQVANGTFVPYTPPAISNATHAGRRVRHNVYGTGVVVRSDSANWWRNGLWEMHPPKDTVVVVAYDNGNVEGSPADRFTLLD